VELTNEIANACRELLDYKLSLITLFGFVSGSDGTRSSIHKQDKRHPVLERDKLWRLATEGRRMYAIVREPSS
jgi:hypothetical protein